MTEKVKKTNAEWQAELTPEQFQVCRMRETERPFSGKYCDEKTPGVYACACCGQELFSSDTKFDSGTGWPSFWKPIADERVTLEIDTSHGMGRVEVTCARCDAHLGHVFEDGPAPTGQRYCMNSVALGLNPKAS